MAGEKSDKEKIQDDRQWQMIVLKIDAFEVVLRISCLISTQISSVMNHGYNLIIHSIFVHEKHVY